MHMSQSLHAKRLRRRTMSAVQLAQLDTDIFPMICGSTAPFPYSTTTISFDPLAIVHDPNHVLPSTTLANRSLLLPDTALRSYRVVGSGDLAEDISLGELGLLGLIRLYFYFVLENVIFIIPH